MIIKKNIKVFALLAGILIYASCSEDKLLVEAVKLTKDAVEGNMTFTACMSGNDDDGTTRTALGSDGASVLWSEGDAISVFSSWDGKNTCFRLSSGDGTKSGTFSGFIEKGSEYFAFYPYDANLVYHFGANTYVTYSWNGATQTAVKGSFPTNTPMVALATPPTGAAEASLAFKNVCAYVKVTTDYPCSSIALTAKDENAVLAAAKINVTLDGGVPSGSYLNGVSNTITLSGKDGAILEAGTYYIAVLPCQLSNGFDLSFTNQYKEKTWTKSTTKTVSFERNKVLNLGEIAIKSEMVKMAGSGTAADPYIIHDFDQLKHMSEFVNTSTGGGDCYKQVADIDAGGQTLKPIGKNEDHMFKGTYDGDGHTLKNIKSDIIYMSHATNVSNGDKDILHDNCFINALFGITSNATIRNLVVENIDLSNLQYHENLSKWNNIQASLIGVAYGNVSTNIENVTVKGTSGLCTSAVYYTYGSLVAMSFTNLNITNCSNFTSIDCKLDTNHPKMGGMVGLAMGKLSVYNDKMSNAEIHINKCRNYGDIIIEYRETTSKESGFACTAFVGGIIGLGSEGYGMGNIITSITNCVNFGTMQIKGPEGARVHEYIGAIVGDMDSDGYTSDVPYIRNCINNASVSGFYSSLDSYSGGIVGTCYDNNTHLVNCANIGTIAGNNTGNLVGNGKGTFSGCDTQSSLADYISVMNTNRPDGFCAWKYASDSNNKLDLDF